MLCFLLSGQRPTGATFEFLGTVFLCAPVCLCVVLCGAKSSRDAGSSLRDTRLLVRCAGKDPLLRLTIRSFNFFFLNKFLKKCDTRNPLNGSFGAPTSVPASLRQCEDAADN